MCNQCGDNMLTVVVTKVETVSGAGALNRNGTLVPVHCGK